MSPKLNIDPHELTADDEQWLRCVTPYLAAVGLSAPRMPMHGGAVDALFAAMGYDCNEKIRAREHGVDASDSFDVGDVRRLHAKLEEREYWKRFPNAAHDGKKSIEILAIELVAWLSGLSAPHKLAWVQAVDWQWLLTLLAASNDPGTQADLLAIAARKLGIPAPASPTYWAAKCEGSATLAKLLDGEPGSKAHQ